MKICIIGSLDTKSGDIEYLISRFRDRGFQTCLIDTSVIGESDVPSDIPPGEVARLGGEPLESLRKRGDRGHALEIMSRGAVKAVRKLFEQSEIDAVLGIGGGAGTSLACAAMRALPLGIPKVMLSTLASGTTDIYIREKDIVMVPSIVDIAGVNRISAGVYARAAGALIGMLEAKEPEQNFKPLIGASMFGNTTPAVQRCKEILEQGGKYEVLIFHANGTGGRTMETLIREDRMLGVLDITTTELADFITGGVMSAGENRLTAAGDRAIPQVTAPGCLDMVNFWGRESIPAKYREDNNRTFYIWNPNVTLMRTTPEENEILGKLMAEKLNRSRGSSAVVLPLKGFSLLDAPGEVFWQPEADEAFFRSLRKYINSEIEIAEVDANINDPVFAETAAELLLRRMK